MRTAPDLSAVLHSLLDKPLLGPKPDQLLVFKRPQLAVKLQSLMQPADTTVAKQANSKLVNKAIAALYQQPALHDHVVGWAPVRSGQQNAEVHLCFKDDSAYYRQQLAQTGSIQLQLHEAAASVSLPVSTVAAKQLPDITTVRMHNVPGGVNVHGLMECLLHHFQLGPEYSVVSEYGGDASGDIAAVTPLWCRSDVCVAEVRAPVQDAKLSKLPTAFTCFGQQVSISVQPSILAKAHSYRSKAQAQPQQAASVPNAQQSSRQKRRQTQKAKYRQRQQQPQHQQHHLPQPLSSNFCRPTLAEQASQFAPRVALARPLDPVSDLGGQCDRAGLGHQPPVPMQVDSAAAIRSGASCGAEAASADPVPMQLSLPAQSAGIQRPTPVDTQTQQPDNVDISMPQAASPVAAAAPAPHELPDGPATSAMLLWAEEFDLPVAAARQAVLHVHNHHAKLVSKHQTGSHVSLAGPLQQLMTRAVRVVTGDNAFNRPQKQPQTSAAPRRSSRQHKPASKFWCVPPGPKGAHQ